MFNSEINREFLHASHKNDLNINFCPLSMGLRNFKLFLSIYICH